MKIIPHMKKTLISSRNISELQNILSSFMFDLDTNKLSFFLPPFPFAGKKKEWGFLLWPIHPKVRRNSLHPEIRIQLTAKDNHLTEVNITVQPKKRNEVFYYLFEILILVFLSFNFNNIGQGSVFSISGFLSALFISLVSSIIIKSIYMIEYNWSVEHLKPLLDVCQTDDTEHNQ